jgi:hypothetical protein
LGDINKGKKPNKKMLDWIDKEMEIFYEQTPVLKLDNPYKYQHEDNLWIHRQVIRKKLEGEN